MQVTVTDLKKVIETAADVPANANTTVKFIPGNLSYFLQHSFLIKAQLTLNWLLYDMMKNGCES